MSLGVIGGASIPGDTPKSLLAKLVTVDGPGSKLDADLTLAPMPRSGGSFGGFPSSSSGIPMPFADPATVVSRYLLGN
jgi:hypothetical protein